MKKKLLSILLAAVLVLSMAACGESQEETPDQNETENNGQEGENSQGEAEGSGPAYVTAPITIDFWHTFGSGLQAEYMADAVSRFNESNEYGITVNATYIGNYTTLRSQLTTSIGAQDNPQVAVLGMSDILASAGVLVDMQPYVDRDGISLDGVLDGVKTSMYYEDQLTAMPFARSCTLFYYNVDMFAAAGYDAAPTTIDELVEACRTVSEQNGNYGFEMLIDMSFYQEALLRSLGSEGLIDEDRQGASCLDDGTFLQMLSDWESWIDEGWSVAPTVTDGTNNMYQMMYSGELASCFASSASLSTLVEYGKESGVNIAVAPMPTYDGVGGVGGGGDVSIIGANNDEQQIAAAWEFVKFLMSDEEVAIRSEQTGYLPTSQGAADLMADLFATDNNMKVAYDARVACEDVPGCTQRSEWQTQAATAVSYVIQDKSMSPEEAIEYLKSMLQTVFY